MLRLYKFVESCLDDTYETVVYDSIDTDKQGQVGIFLYQSSDDEETLDETQWESIKAQVQVTANPGEAGIQEVSDYLRSFIDKIEGKYESGLIGLEIINCHHIGGKVLKIKTFDNNISMWRSVIDIKYKLN